MVHPFKLLLAGVVVAGFAAVPTIAQAAEGKVDKSEATSAGKKSEASNDFEENRRAHMQKSKENNTKKE